MVITCIGDCMQTLNHITNTKVNSTFHLFEVGKSSAGLSGWDFDGVAGNTFN